MLVKLEWLGYRMLKKTVTICWAVFIQYQRVTDRQTDRRTDRMLYQYRASAAVCWRAIKMRKNTHKPNLSLKQMQYTLHHTAVLTNYHCSRCLLREEWQTNGNKVTFQFNVSHFNLIILPNTNNLLSLFIVIYLILHSTSMYISEVAL